MANSNLPFVFNFNPVTAVKEALKVSSRNLKDSMPIAAELTTLIPVNISETSKIFQAGFLAGWIDKYAFAAYVQNSQTTWSGLFGHGVRGDIIEYGDSLDIKDVEKLLDTCVSRDLAENNQRAIASGHGLI